ncbi:MAG: methyltransferase [Oscillospiraceae bacterium]|nr:methyltransferase [Oscillospiraceae bacterium]MBR3083599.1 methyltransferase [Oscillospiraceae bacterium]MBR3860447.1 methyltransferase [Oscillospiraceae bacterium]MBR7056781.1 methyltransferase [Oscillospiraceae bacterium]
MTETLWPGGPQLNTDAAFPLSTDSVLLAHFAAGLRARRILDLGCGAGVLAVLLAERHPGAEIGGIELLPEAAARCRENFAANGLDPAGVLCADLRDCRSLYAPGRFDLVVSNPPYFPLGRGYSAPEAARAAARDERNCTLDELCAAAAYLTRWGGAFALVHRPERLSELCCTLSRHGLEPKRLRLVHYRAGWAPNLLLLESRRGGKPGLNIEKPLLLTDGQGGDSAEMQAVYHR